MVNNIKQKWYETAIWPFYDFETCRCLGCAILFRAVITNKLGTDLLSTYGYLEFHFVGFQFDR